MRAIFRCCVVVLVFFLSAHGPIRADTAVVPPFLADTEGNSVAASTPCPPGGLRFQLLYPASDFLALPEGQRTLVQMAFRPDHGVSGPRSAHFPDFELRFSTTTRTAKTLSNTFADNIGPDETVVFFGDLDTYTDGTGPPEGPHAFDYVIDLQTPFVYDPIQGNLLLEMLTGPAVGIPAFDAHELPAGPYRALAGFNRSASEAGIAFQGAVVSQFVVVPEPSTATSIFVLGITLTTIGRWRKRKRREPHRSFPDRSRELQVSVNHCDKRGGIVKTTL